MINYKNNNRRNKFRSNNRNFRSNGSSISNLGLKNNFQRRYSNGNNNAPKLIEKYNNLAREALSNGDKILSENYYQHADHFLRILLEKRVTKVEPKKEKEELITKDI
jgi:hypothetical protein|tara:strand:- start:95 stop:415 length:321 start_codon:yes stop_codon:yes gene_type:complete